jgi:hypothetical protein
LSGLHNVDIATYQADPSGMLGLAKSEPDRAELRQHGDGGSKSAT